MTKQITIIGLGLIGGSLALAIKRSNPEVKIIGMDKSSENINIALKKKAIDKGTTDFKEGVTDSDIVFLATPINAMFEVARKIAPYLKKQTIVTDVGSCKTDVIKVMESILPADCCFIGGHPMAGSEQAGMISADPYLFQNAVYVLTPTPKTNLKALEILTNFIKTIDANIIVMDPDKHDLIVAAVSHLPHLIAVNLVNCVGEYAAKETLTLSLAAGGFRDTTRIAMGNEIVWSDIFTNNKPMILQVLQSFKQHLAKFESLLSAGNYPELKNLIYSAKKIRESIPLKAKGLLPKINELTVKVPDEPGAIAKIANILSEKDINIIDIEILRVREGEDGAIRIGLKEESDLDSALLLLKEHNFEVKRR